MSADMSKATAREPGWYWAKDSAGWTAVEFDANEDTPRWRYRGAWVTAQYFDAAFEEIGPRILDPDAATERSAWLLRLLQWCRPRLKPTFYQVLLDQYLEDGPTPPPNDPPVVQSNSARASLLPGEEPS